MATSSFRLRSTVGAQSPPTFVAVADSETGAVLNRGPATVYYGNSPSLTVATAAGSITAGQSVAIPSNGPYFLIDPATSIDAPKYALLMSTTVKSTISDPQVIVDIAYGDGVTDRTAYLAALIAAAAGRQVRIAGGTWAISELTLISGANVDATGANFVLANNTAKRFLVNTSLMLGSPGSVRDTNIQWRGGTFDRGVLDSRLTMDGMNLMFGFVDGLRLRDISVIQVNGAYGLYLYGVTNFTVSNWTATSNAINAGTLQCYGGCRDGVFSGVYGTYGDDCVALVPRNPTIYEIAGQIGLGDIRNVTIENVFCDGQRAGVKVLGGKNDAGTVFYRTDNITVRNVDGSFGAAAISQCAALVVGGDSNYAPLTSSFVGNVTCDQVTQRLTGAPACRVRDTGFVNSLVLRGVRSLDTTVASINLDTVTHAGSIKICDCEYYSTVTSGSYYPIVSGTFIRKLILSNLRLNAMTTGTATTGLLNASGGSLGSLMVENNSVIGKGYSVGKIAVTARCFFRGLQAEDANHLGYFESVSGAVIDVREFSAYPTALDDFVKTAGTVTAWTPDFRCDISKLTVTANSLAYNTNAGLACGAGPVICNGTSWKHLYTGTVYP